MFVSALLRRVSASGGFGAVVRRGNREAGAINILERNRSGEVVLFGPAPQMAYSGAKPDERFFTEILRSQNADDMASRLEKEARYDPDIWVVEIEPGSVQTAELLEIVD